MHSQSNLPTNTIQNCFLLTAALRSDFAMAKDALEKGADVNARDANGETPLMFASFYGDEALVKELISRGADVQAKSRNNGSALTMASYKGNAAIVKLLIDAHADVHALVDDGSSALKLAASKGHYNVVNLLLNAGALPDIPDGHGVTALEAAKQKHHLDVVRAINDELEKLSGKDFGNKTKLHHASCSFYSHTVPEFIVKMHEKFLKELETEDEPRNDRVSCNRKSGM